jgi:hypothetical protein
VRWKALEVHSILYPEVYRGQREDVSSVLTACRCPGGPIGRTHSPARGRPATAPSRGGAGEGDVSDCRQSGDKRVEAMARRRDELSRLLVRGEGDGEGRRRRMTRHHGDFASRRPLAPLYPPATRCNQWQPFWSCPVLEGRAVQILPHKYSAQRSALGLAAAGQCVAS